MALPKNAWGVGPEDEAEPALSPLGNGRNRRMSLLKLNRMQLPKGEDKPLVDRLPAKRSNTKQSSTANAKENPSAGLMSDNLDSKELDIHVEVPPLRLDDLEQPATRQSIVREVTSENLDSRTAREQSDKEKSQASRKRKRRLSSS